MPFIKDPDAYTRGSGAIASSDYRNPRRAAERRARLERSAMIDRRRAQYTYGTRGGVGAIDGSKLGMTGRPVIIEGGNVESPTSPQVGSGRAPTPKAPTVTGGTGGGGFFTQLFQPPAATTRPMVEAGTGQRTWIDPGPAPAPSPGGIPVPDPMLPVTTTTPFPTATPVTQAPSSGMSSTSKALLIAAAIVGGAYLYTRSKRG